LIEEYGGVDASEDDGRESEAARIRDRKKKKLHFQLMRQMRELQGGDSDSGGEYGDLAVPTERRRRSKKIKTEVNKEREREKIQGWRGRKKRR
jgi:hypothetical protein